MWCRSALRSVPATPSSSANAGSDPNLFLQMPGQEVEAALFGDAGTRRVVTRPFIAVEAVLRAGIDVNLDVGPLGANGIAVAERNARVLFTEMKLGRYLRRVVGEADDGTAIIAD